MLVDSQQAFFDAITSSGFLEKLLLLPLVAFSSSPSLVWQSEFL